MIDYKKLNNLTPEDFEWSSEIFKQAQICKAEANALEQFMITKLQDKYSIQLQFGDQLNIKTGNITRTIVSNTPKE